MADADNSFQQSLPDSTPPDDEGTILPPETPTQIGPYKIETLLEKGGMSILYLGSHPKTREPTTIKVLSPKYLSHPEIVQRFLKEAEIIAMANHPNIVQLYGYGDWENGLYIAMEFIQGISLRQYILQNPVSLKKALEILLDIAYALCHLHTHGIIHRDLKPENIIITDEGTIKVIDFGIAQLLSERPEPGMPSKQRTIGTPIYMSPEQREDPEMVSYPSDIYSLGIIAYELVLGKLSHGQIHLSLMPKGLQKILNRALQPKPEDRYHEIVEFITDLTSYLNSPNMLKEKKVGDQLSELSENLRFAQNILQPLVTPQWEGIEFGLANTRGTELAGLYYDFLPLRENAYVIIFGESSAKGAEAIVYTAILRGMVRALFERFSSPAHFVFQLNKMLAQDSMDQVFTLAYVLLLPEENKICYCSCGFKSLWLMPADTNFPKKLTIDNIALGIDPSNEFIERTLDWHAGDTIILDNFSFYLSKDEKFTPATENIVHRAIKDYATYPPQKQAEGILRKIKLSAMRDPSHSLFLMTILRL
jgi:hypothetical protein